MSLVEYALLAVLGGLFVSQGGPRWVSRVAPGLVQILSGRLLVLSPIVLIGTWALISARVDLSASQTVVLSGVFIAATYWPAQKGPQSAPLAIGLAVASFVLTMFADMSVFMDATSLGSACHLRMDIDAFFGDRGWGGCRQSFYVSWMISAALASACYSAWLHVALLYGGTVVHKRDAW